MASNRNDEIDRNEGNANKVNEAVNKEMERRNYREGWRRWCGGRDRRGEREVRSDGEGGKGRF